MQIIRTRAEALDAMLAKPLALQFPALDGFIVTEGHARICREQGHTTRTFGNGQCQRCGERATMPSAESLARALAATTGARQSTVIYQTRNADGTLTETDRATIEPRH